MTVENAQAVAESHALGARVTALARGDADALPVAAADPAGRLR